LAGEFSRQILSAWMGRSLTLLDCWEPQDPSVYLDIKCADPASHNANRRLCDDLASRDGRVTLLQAYTPAAAAHFDDGAFDWVYLDANHSFRTVREDLEAWWPKIRPGGLFAGHDYFDGFVPKGGLFGVQSAVDRFARKVGRAAAFSQYDGLYRTWYF